MVALCVQRDNATENGLAPIATGAVFRHDTWADLDFQPQIENPSKNGSTSDTALEVLDFGTWFVHVEGTDDDEAWIRSEIANRNRNPLDNVFIDSIDVILELGRDGNDW